LERKRSIVLLPGRWRRPYHDDPRNLPIASKLANRPEAVLCFYTVPFGPVPIELDETFPLAQTESFDGHDPARYAQRAKQVAAWVKHLSPKQVFLVSEGEYGRIVGEELSRRAVRPIIIRILGGSKPDRTARSIVRRLS
jgi:hypothetical protein